MYHTGKASVKTQDLLMTKTHKKLQERAIYSFNENVY